MTVTGKNTLTFKDVLIGEVWLCSGQSNMSFYLKGAANGEEAVKESNRPKMRLFTVDRIIPNQPVDEMKGEWKVSSPETTPEFSAVGYLFGQQLQEKLNQPVGLINSSWGGTRGSMDPARRRSTRSSFRTSRRGPSSGCIPRPSRARNPNPSDRTKPRRVLYNGMISAVRRLRDARRHLVPGRNQHRLRGALSQGSHSADRELRGEMGRGRFPLPHRAARKPEELALLADASRSRSASRTRSTQRRSGRHDRHRQPGQHPSEGQAHRRKTAGRFGAQDRLRPGRRPTRARHSSRWRSKATRRSSTSTTPTVD